MLDEVEIGCREFFEPMSQIPDHGHCFEKHLRQNYSRSDIQENSAAVELFSHGTEESKIAVGCFPQCFTRCYRVGMNDIGPDGHMNRNRRAIVVGAQQQA